MLSFFRNICKRKEFKGGSLRWHTAEYQLRTQDYFSKHNFLEK